MGYPEREAWKMTPYKIITLTGFHMEYQQKISFTQARPFMQTASRADDDEDDIDTALGGF